jgi:hypothetical protein
MGLVLGLASGLASAGGPRIFADGFAGSAPVAKSGLGTNLEGVEDFAAAYPFTDFFKQSRPWITASQTVFDTDDAAQLDLDADGWVRSLPACTADPQQFCRARTVINSAGAEYPSGSYLVLYQGNGTITYSGGASKNNALSAPGRDVVTVDGNSIWILTLESTAAAPNHVRNIRVYPPGFDPALASVPTFHPDFVAQLAPYRTLRFMDWMRTNGGGFGGAPNNQQVFSDRALPTDAHWTREGGVPLEVMIELANLVDAEPWFTIPHKAGDAYVTAFAQAVLAQLDAGRRVYVEHSNEVWNSFPQGFDVEDAALVTFPDGPDSPFTKRMNQHGLRTAQICALFRAAFGAQAARVECTLGAQAANSFTATEAGDCPLAISRGLRATACLAAGDNVAIAPYFGNYLDVPANADELQAWTLNDLFAEIEDGGQLDGGLNDSATPCTDMFPPIQTLPCPIGALEEVEFWEDAQFAEASSRSLSLIAYEGGQHLVGVFGVENNAAVTNLFIAGNRDARMGAAYLRYLDRWKANGGELFVHFNLSFNYGRFGSWGVLETLTPAAPTPKQQAIATFNAANPCWWTGCTN